MGWEDTWDLHAMQLVTLIDKYGALIISTRSLFGRAWRLDKLDRVGKTAFFTYQSSINNYSLGFFSLTYRLALLVLQTLALFVRTLQVGAMLHLSLKACWGVLICSKQLHTSKQKKKGTMNWFGLNLLLVFLSTISAILSGTIGIHYGHVLIHFKVKNFRLQITVPVEH